MPLQIRFALHAIASVTMIRSILSLFSLGMLSAEKQPSKRFMIVCGHLLPRSWPCSDAPVCLIARPFLAFLPRLISPPLRRFAPSFNRICWHDLSPRMMGIREGCGTGVENAGMCLMSMEPAEQPGNGRYRTHRICLYPLGVWTRSVLLDI